MPNCSDCRNKSALAVPRAWISMCIGVIYILAHVFAILTTREKMCYNYQIDWLTVVGYIY